MESMKTQKIFFYIMLFVMAASIILPGIHPMRPKAPQAVNGVLDLTRWDAEKDGTVALNGECEFYYGSLLSPRDFVDRQPAGRTLQKVPAKWSSYRIGDIKLSPYGTAVYRLKILLPAESGSYGIKITSIYASARIFADGRPILSCGIPGDSPETTEHEYYADTAYFDTGGGQVEILVQAANYISSYSGIFYEIHFGSQKSVTALRMYNFFVDSALIAGMIFISLYFFVLGLQRKNSPELLFFAAYCLFTAIYDSTCSEVLLNYAVPGLSYNASVKIQVLSLILSLHSLFRLVYHTFKAAYSRKANLLINGVVVFFILLTCFTDFYLWNYTYILFSAGNIYVVSMVIYILWKHTHAAIEGRYYLYTAIISSVALFATSLFNIVLALESDIFIPVFQPVFVLSLALYMSGKYENSYKTIERLSARLSVLDRLKDDFLAKTSHEVKTPLNGVINISQSLLDGSGGTLSPAQAEDIRLIVSIGKRLSTLIRDILDYSKLKVMDITLKTESIDLHQVAESAAYIFRHLIKGRPLEIENKIPPAACIVLADENRLTQILSNLLDNAVKFTSQGTITITARLEGDLAYVSVRDTGMGIPQNRLKDIFTSYDQVESITADSTGVGLGLSITRQLVELHKGRIFAESEPGKGSCFTFSLPRGERGKSGQDASGKAKEGEGQDTLPENGSLPYTVNVGGEFSVLVVDDEYSNLKSLLNTLTVCKYNVTAAGDAESALQLLEGALQYDLCILDLMMPGMSGYEACRKIRQTYSPLELPILLLTAKALPEALEAGFAAGANDFVHKPFEAEELKSRIKTLVQLKKSKELLLEKETAFLQAQIRPHFLFNALNTISSLCYTNPSKAGELLAELGIFLRRSVDFASTSSFITVEKELRLVRAYVAIEKARFGKQLEVEYDIQPAVLKYGILPLTVQPIVENSIRHGLMKRSQGGRVVLSCQFDEGRILIQVTDNGVGIAGDILEALSHSKSEAQGVGLANIRRRLWNFYGAPLDISSEKDHGTTVSFSIPAKYAQERGGA